MGNASALDAPYEALFDRTACLVPDVQVFTADGTWTKPAHALWVEITMVGGGGAGGNRVYTTQGAEAGAGGGSSGAMLVRQLPASLMTDFATVTVGTGGEPGTPATASELAWDTFYLRAGPGEAGGDAVEFTPGAGGAAPGGTTMGGMGAAGGDGGDDGVAPPDSDGKDGDRGYCCVGGIGGAAGPWGGSPDYGRGGGAGIGYGAGGGGAGGQLAAFTASYSGGGGGGGGGYGWGNTAATVLAEDGGEGSTGFMAGGDGADGIVIITTWCGINLR